MDLKNKNKNGSPCSQLSVDTVTVEFSRRLRKCHKIQPEETGAAEASGRSRRKQVSTKKKTKEY